MHTEKSFIRLPFLTIIFLFMIASSNAQIGRVGINTTTPEAMLHVKDSSVVFTGGGTSLNSPPPVTGPGIRMMWYPARAAFRAGSVTGIQWNRDTIGFHSFACGHNTIASGDQSFAAGIDALASGTNSFAIGRFSVASGINSFAGGEITKATGWNSFASGYVSDAFGDHSFVCGFNNEAYGESSFAGGYNCGALGANSFSIGSGTLAIGVNSFATGLESYATGETSAAFGSGSEASGSLTFAAGYQATASQIFATAIGTSLIANTNNLFVIGRLNDTTAINGSWSDSDPLFVIGNGSANNNRRNALTVLKGGNVGITTSAPQTKLHITGGSDAGVGSTSGYLLLGQTTSDNIVLDNNEILARSNGGNSTLHLQSFGGDLSLCSGIGKVGIGNDAPYSKLHVTTGSNITSYNSEGYTIFGPTAGVNMVMDANDILVRNNGLASTLFLQSLGGDLSLCDGSGKVGIGNNTPSSKLHVTDGTSAELNSNGFLQLGPTNSYNLVFDEDEILARNSGAGAELKLQNSGDLRLCDGTGRVSIGDFLPVEKLTVEGNGFFYGNVTAWCGVFTCPSDIRYKTNIKPIENALQSVNALHGITYDWDRENFPQKKFNDVRQIGVSAQELEAVFPEMVFTDKDGYKTVDYSRLTPVLIEAVKELSAKLEQQETEIEQVKLASKVEVAELKSIVLQMQQEMQQLVQLQKAN